jgi:Recombinase
MQERGNWRLFELPACQLPTGSSLARRANMMCVIHSFVGCIEGSRNHSRNDPDKRNERIKEIFIGNTLRTGRAWYKSAIRSQRVKDAVERNARAGKRTGGGSRPFGYKILRHDLGEGGRRRYRIIGEEIEPAEAEAIKEAASRVLRGESIRSIAFDFNDRGIKPVGGGRWAGSMLRRMLISPRIAGLREPTARWSATRCGPRSSTAPPMIG